MKKYNNIIKIFIFHFITIFISVIYGKLNAQYIKPESVGLYTLQYGVMTFLHSFLIGPIVNNFKTSFNNTSNSLSLTVYFSRILLIVYALSLLVVIILIFYFYDFTYLIIWLAFTFQGLYTFSDEFLLLNFHYTKNSVMKIIYNFLLVLLFLLIAIYFGEKNNQGLWLILSLATTINFCISGYNSYKIFVADTKKRPLSIFKQAPIWDSFWKYSLPLMGLAIFSWISNYIDRFIIDFYLNKEAVGIYAMTYGLGSRILLISSPFVTYLTPIIYSNGDRQLLDNYNFFLNIIRYYLCIVFCACIALYLFKNLIGSLFLAQFYQMGFFLIPIIGIAYAFLGCINIIEIKFYANNQIKYILWHNLFGAVLSLVLSLILVPLWGLGGAAFGTLISKGVQLVIVIYFLKG